MRNKSFNILIGCAIMMTGGCWTPYVDYYSRHLTDMGHSFPPSKTIPKAIPVGESLCAKEECATDKILKDGIVLGHSTFYAPWTPEIFALNLGKRLGATHVIFERKYKETEEHDEIRTGYDIGFSTSHTTTTANSYSYGSVYSPYGGYIGNYNQSTYGYGSASTSSTSLIPYHYQAHVSTPIFEHRAIYVRVTQGE